MAYIPIYEWWIFTVNVGKYTSPMDAIGIGGIKQLPILGELYDCF